MSHAPFDVGSWITLRWTRGTRYYRVHLELDLWTGWLSPRYMAESACAWGARSCEQKRLFLLAAIAKHRRQRGYPFDA